MSEFLGEESEKSKLSCNQSNGSGLCSADLEPRRETGLKKVMHKLHDFFLGDNDGPRVHTAKADGDASKVSAKDARAAAKSLAYLDKNVHIVAYDMAPGGRLTFNKGYANNINSDYIASASFSGESGLRAPKYHGVLAKELDKRLPAIEETMRQELLALNLKAGLTGVPNSNIEQLGQSLQKLQTHHQKLNDLINPASSKVCEQTVSTGSEQAPKRTTVREFAQELVQLSDDLKEAQKIQKRVRKDLER
jgi:hypothetical protein